MALRVWTTFGFVFTSRCFPFPAINMRRTPLTYSLTFHLVSDRSNQIEMKPNLTTEETSSKGVYDTCSRLEMWKNKIHVFVLDCVVLIGFYEDAGDYYHKTSLAFVIRE